MSTHWHAWTARTTLLTILLLLGTAAPAFAGPAPLDEGRRSGGATSPTADPSSTDLSTWGSIAIGAAGTLAIVLVAFALTVLVRRAHRGAPHPA
jgi:ABC-type Fe3+ transport system permease subunit